MAYVVNSQLVGNTRILVVDSSAIANDANGNAVSVAVSVSAVIDYSNSINSLVSSLNSLNNHTANVVNNLIEINAHLASIKSDINQITLRANTRSLGIFTQEANTPFTRAQARALAVSAVKESGGIDRLSAEISNPTSLPGDE